MAFLYLYAFENNLKEGDPSYEALKGNKFLYIYAESEVVARQKFEKEFDIDAGKLIERRPW